MIRSYQIFEVACLNMTVFNKQTDLIYKTNIFYERWKVACLSEQRNVNEIVDWNKTITRKITDQADRSTTSPVNGATLKRTLEIVFSVIIMLNTFLKKPFHTPLHNGERGN